MAEYRYIGDEPRYFPTLGLHLEPQQTFSTDAVVSSTLVLTADGAATHVDDQGVAVEDPTTNADPNPDAGIVVADDQVDEAEAPAEYTLEQLTKAELLDLAQDLDLHGRSQMTKDELITALREAAQVTPEQQATAEAAIDAAVAGVGQTETTTEPAGGAESDPEE